MQYLPEVQSQHEIQDGGLKKGNAMSSMVILELTFYASYFYALCSHITQKYIIIPMHTTTAATTTAVVAAVVVAVIVDGSSN